MAKLPNACCLAMQQDMMHIACAADSTYVPHAATMLHSVLDTQSNPAEYQVHFLHGPELPASDINCLQVVVDKFSASLCCHEIADAWVAGLPSMGRISRAMWYRIFLPQLVPEAQRVLYLDCDVIAAAELDELRALNLDGYYVAAVKNVFERGHAPKLQELSQTAQIEYFNSGVLLMNLALWRQESCTERLLKLVEDRGNELLWPDQDAMNLLFSGRWLQLSPRWNCQNSFFYFANAAEVFSTEALHEARTHPALLHFEGGDLAKPWHYLCKNPFRERYFHHRQAAGLSFPQIEGRNLQNAFLRTLPRLWVIPALRLLQRLHRVLRWRLVLRTGER